MKSIIHLENSLVLQARIEGLTPQQILLRDLLVNKYQISNEDATKLVTGTLSIEECIRVLPCS